MRPGDWRSTTFGQQAINHAVQVFGGFSNSLDLGHPDEVKKYLRRWRGNYDWSQVPSHMLDRTDELCDGIKRALDDSDDERARQLIDDVCDWWLGQSR